MTEAKRPIIKKVKKVVGGGGHGGAWKVAYADFVTAMMAFFLLLWLISISSKEQLSGISDYFTGNIIGEMQKPGMKNQPEGQTQAKQDNTKNTATVATTESINNEIIEKIQTMFSRTENDRIKIVKSSEGISLLIFNGEDDKDPNNFKIFEPNKYTVSKIAEELLTKVSEIIKFIPRYVSVTGFAKPGEKEQWLLALLRAESSRKFIQSESMQNKLVELSAIAENTAYQKMELSEAFGKKKRQDGFIGISIMLLNNSSLDKKTSQDSWENAKTDNETNETNKKD